MSVDSSNLIYNQNSVTSDLLYNLKPSSGASRRYRASIPPSNFHLILIRRQMLFFKYLVVEKIHI